MSSDDVQTNLRLPADLKERLVDAASANNRSLSAEVAYRLEESFQSKSAEVVVFEELLQGRLGELEARMEMIDVRIAMTRTRLDSASVRARLARRDLDLVAARPDHPENDTILQAAQTELDLVQSEVDSSEIELKGALKSRQFVLEEIEETRRLLADGKASLEKRLEDDPSLRQK